MSGVRYARSGDASIAFRRYDGETEGEVVVVTSATMPMDAWVDDHVGRRFLDGLRRLGSVVVFDRRGVGLSDPLDHDSQMLYVEWTDNLRAVLDAAELWAPNIVTANLPEPAVLLATRSPDRVRSLVLYEPNLRWFAPAPGSSSSVIDGEIDIVGLVCPTRADEPGFREWFDRAGQAGASPAVARRIYERPGLEETRILQAAFEQLAKPTVLLRRPRASLLTDAVVDRLLPGVPRVELPGRDNLIVGEEVDALLAEISRFVAGEVRLPEPERTVTAILFTDLVGSTQRAHEVGDQRWRALIEVHDSTVRRIIEHRGGRVVKSTGDGVMGLLPAASGAVHCARLIRRTLRDDGLEVRIGVHIGDVDRRGDDVSGLAVNIAARIMSMAAAGEILVSESTVLAAGGEDLTFVERGRHALKGLPGEWTLHALEPQQN